MCRNLIFYQTVSFSHQNQWLKYKLLNLTHLISSFSSLGFSIFYPCMSMDVKIQGVTGFWFFQRFLSQGIFFQGVSLQCLPFLGWQTQKIFQVSFFSEELNCLRLNSRGFWVKQSFFPGRIGFSKFGRPCPCMDKKWNSPIAW